MDRSSDIYGFLDPLNVFKRNEILKWILKQTGNQWRDLVLVKRVATAFWIN